MIWAMLAALAILVVVALLWPLVRERANSPEERRDMTVLKDQLNEVAREQTRGTMSEDEAAAIRLEIQRRLLAAGRRPARLRLDLRQLATQGGIGLCQFIEPHCMAMQGDLFRSVRCFRRVVHHLDL